MAPSDPQLVSAAIRNFIIRYIDSVELIQVLLLLRKDPQREWTVEEITTELRSSLVGITKRLDDLYNRRILKKTLPNKHRYTPYDPEMARQIEELLQCNQTYPFRVIELIYSRGEEAMRDLADAFKLKKDR